ncbi:MAG: acyltransferase [Reyranella sp.]|uniref:acyltransferase n=1 Tax=Reyranella sp. TaxID=1929291 RepID=UPI003D117BB4
MIRGASIGADCNIAPGAMIDGSTIGDRCVVCQNFGAGPGFLIGNDVFLGPNVVMSNDFFPAASKDGFDAARYRAGEWAIIVEGGAAIGANAVILPGIRIGRGAMVGAGAVASRDVPPDTLLARDGRLMPITAAMRSRRMRFVEPRC